MKSISEKRCGFLERFAAKCGMSSSKLLSASILAAFLVSVSYVLLAWGVPAPAEIKFYGNTTSNYTNSTAFSVNWTMSDTSYVSNYTIYIFNSTQLVNITSNMTTGGGALGYYFSIGVNGGNYTFNVSARNQSAGDSGANATSAWMFVDTAAPNITSSFSSPQISGTFLPGTANGSVVSNKQTLTFNISTLDLGSGSAFCKVNIGNVANVTAPIASNWCNVAGVSMASLALGVQKINIYVNDTVGNMHYNNSYAVTIGGPVVPGVTQWNTTNAGPSLNLTNGTYGSPDMFFYDGDTVYAVANYTTVGSDGAVYAYDNLTVNVNFSVIGNSSAITATNLGGGLYNASAMVNYTNITLGGGSVSQFSGGGIVFLAQNFTGPGQPSAIGAAVAVLVNMSTIPSCPPNASQIPPAVPWNGSLKYVANCTTTCTGTTPVQQINSSHVSLCGPTFGASTTNFSAIALTGNFSRVPLVIDVPGKAKIDFSSSPVDMSTQEKSSAIMQFAMKNLMARGQFGINESEWNGQGGKPNLNVSATLTLYNLTSLLGAGNHYSIGFGSFNGMEAPTSPSVCPPARCSGISLTSDGNLTFTVSSFSSYVIGSVNYTLRFANVSGAISQSVNQSVNATYYLNISNLGNNTDTIVYNLSRQGIGIVNVSQIALNSSTMGGITWVVVNLNVSNATAGIYQTNTTATLANNSAVVHNSLTSGLNSPITTTVLDSTMPAVLGGLATPSSANPGATVKLNVTITDNVNISRVFANLTLIGGNAFTAMARVSGTDTNAVYEYNATIAVGTLNNTYGLTLLANDTSGNMNSSQTITLTVNNVSPVVTVLYPNGGNYIRGTVTANATVTDNNGNSTVANVTFYYTTDGSTYTFIGWQNVSQGNAVYNVSWDTSGLTSDTVRVLANATDGILVGNDTSDAALVVDNTAPSFSAISVTGGNIYAGDFNFSVTVNEPHFSSASYRIVNATNSSIVWAVNTTGIAANGTFASIAFDGIYLPVGNWTINVSAVDLLGNTNSSATNITSYAAIQAPSTYDSRVQAPGTIGSGTAGIYNFTIYAKGYQYVRMYLNLTSGNDKFVTAGNTDNAKLSNVTNAVAIDDKGSYDSASTLVISSITTAALPAYSTANLTTGLYKQPVQLYLYPYSGLSAGTYSGSFGFGISSTQ